MSASVANLPPPSTLIRGGTIVTAADQFEADLLVRGETIAAIGRTLEIAAERVIDAKGCYVLPGGVDAHAEIGDFETDSLVALRGGTTTLVSVAEPASGGTLFDALARGRERAHGKSLADHAFHVAVPEFTERARHEIRQLVEEEGMPSFEVSLASGDASGLRDSDFVDLLREVSTWGGLVNVRAERLNPASVDRALAPVFAGHHALLFSRLTGEAAFNRVRAAAARNQRAWVETSLSTLLLSEESEQDAYWAGLCQGLVQLVVSGSAASLGHRLELLFAEGVSRGRLSLSRAVEVAATMPAKIFGLYPRKGSIAIGADADLVVFDPFTEHVIAPSTRTPVSPYAGRKSRGCVRSVLLRGALALEDQNPREVGLGFGRCLARGKHLSEKI